jgi:hypothetical protein
MSTEADVTHKKINPFLENLGYSQSIDNEIEYEKPISVGRNKTVFPDIVVNINNVPAFVIDAKKLGENLRFYDKQAISYGLLLRTPYAILTDGNKILAYDVKTEEIIFDGEFDFKNTPFLSKKTLEKQIIKKIENINDAEIERAKEILSVFDDIIKFSEVLYDCENIIRDNDGLTGSDAFDEIAKLLFIKIFYEKRELKGKINEINVANLESRGGGIHQKLYF